MNEPEQKRMRIARFMEEQGLEALLLARPGNFAWATGGRRNYVATASDKGVASLLFTPEGDFVVTSIIEAPRMAGEELAGLGYEVASYSWHEGAEADMIGSLTEGLHLGADGPYPTATNVGAEIACLRWSLLPEEIERYRWLGARCGEAMGRVARQLRPGLSEEEIAARLSAEVMRHGIVPTVLLVGADERAFKYRHPLPTDKRLEKYALLTLCGRKGGLIANLSRLVHFGPLPAELQRKQEAVARVDATFIAYTVPGARAGDVFTRGLEAYAAVGYPDEWKLHHQGGATGYEGRDYKATPSSPEIVQVNQAFTWNPSIAGTKSEDTIIVSEGGYEFLTTSPDWPTIPVEVKGRIVERPAILEVL
ncbi:MAG TPA: aminopeptidase P family protein [Anaerolineae bacterium]|nr:aminopeptidase P family protein [Anaerolineae bacterium]